MYTLPIPGLHGWAILPIPCLSGPQPGCPTDMRSCNKDRFTTTAGVLPLPIATLLSKKTGRTVKTKKRSIRRIRDCNTTLSMMGQERANSRRSASRR